MVARDSGQRDENYEVYNRARILNELDAYLNFVLDKFLKEIGKLIDCPLLVDLL